MTVKLGFCLSAAVAAGVLFASVQDDVIRECETGLRGPNSWGGLKPHPAKVNAVGDMPSPNRISLRGEWDFVWFKSFPARPSWPLWFKPGMNAGQPIRKMKVPGYWQMSFGEEGMAECDSTDNSIKMVRHTSVGMGWYRREVPIPAAWAGKRIWLKVGGITAQGWIWVNEVPTAWVDNCCATVKYDITERVKPGEKALIVICADSKVPCRKALAFHKFGGINRDIELEATPGTLIDDAWVRGDFDRQEAEAHVTVERVERVEKVEKKFTVRVKIEGQVVEKKAEAKGETVVRLPLKDFRPWSPDHPNLYWADIELLEDGVVTMARRERFGVRKFEVRGDRFYLNNRPFFIRGCGFHGVYPIEQETTCSDNERRCIAMAKAAGFNYFRTHTKIFAPEFFEATDELGILVQPELPYYMDYPAWMISFDPLGDMLELYVNYRRFASFATYCTGNEGDLGDVFARRFYDTVKRLDPDRLVLHQDAPSTRSTMPKHNHPGWSDYVGGPMKEWPRGSIRFERPFVTHEYLNLAVKNDAALEPRFTGFWLPPVTMEKRTKWLEQFSLDASWHRPLQYAQHKLQGYWQKHGFESARSDPYLGGYSYWSIRDTTTLQGSQATGQGLFNCFTEVKDGGWKPEEFARFNSPECVLCDFEPECAVAVSGERLTAKILFANYGEKDYANAVAKWTLRTAAGEELLRGETAAGDQPAGPVRAAGTAELTMPTVAKPTKVVFEVKLGAAVNAWERWIFPVRQAKTLAGVAVSDELMPILAKRYAGLLPASEAAKAKVVIGRPGDEIVTAAIGRGAKAITVGDASGKPNVKLGWWNFSDLVGTAMVKHPAFGDFPHEGYLSPLWFRLLKKGQKLDVMTGNVLEKLIVTEGGEQCYYELALCPDGVTHGLELQLRGLDVLADTPEGAWLFDNLVDYMRK